MVVIQVECKNVPPYNNSRIKTRNMGPFELAGNNLQILAVLLFLDRSGIVAENSRHGIQGSPSWALKLCPFQGTMGQKRALNLRVFWAALEIWNSCSWLTGQAVPVYLLILVKRAFQRYPSVHN